MLDRNPVRVGQENHVVDIANERIQLVKRRAGELDEVRQRLTKILQLAFGEHSRRIVLFKVDAMMFETSAPRRRDARRHRGPGPSVSQRPDVVDMPGNVESVQITTHNVLGRA